VVCEPKERHQTCQGIGEFEKSIKDAVEKGEVYFEEFRLKT
jgi:predicted Holliday junction resolvase-like endonuclease